MNWLLPHHWTGNPALSVALESGREQIREWLNWTLQSKCCCLSVVLVVSGVADRVHSLQNTCLHTSPWCLPFFCLYYTERQLADFYPLTLKNHKQIASIMQRKPDWIWTPFYGSISVMFIYPKWMLFSHCLALIYSCCVTRCYVAVYQTMESIQSCIAVCISTPGLTLESQ